MKVVQIDNKKIPKWNPKILNNENMLCEHEQKERKKDREIERERLREKEIWKKREI